MVEIKNFFENTQKEFNKIITIKKHIRNKELIKPNINIEKSPIFINQKRNINERLKDDKENNKITQNLNKWKKNPKKYDMKCVDDKPYFQISIEPTNDPGRYKLTMRKKVNIKKNKKSEKILQNQIELIGKENIKNIYLNDIEFSEIKKTNLVKLIDNVLGEKVGSLDIHLGPSKNEKINSIFISDFFINEKERKKCAGSHLLRELTNIADKNCLDIDLRAGPFEYKKELSLNEKRERIQPLINLYSKYGLKPIKKINDVEYLMERNNKCNI